MSQTPESEATGTPAPVKAEELTEKELEGVSGGTGLPPTSPLDPLRPRKGFISGGSDGQGI